MQRKKVLAIASGGGHWVQLFRMRPAWNDHHVTYATATPGLFPALRKDAEDRGQAPPGYVTIPEANRWQKVKMVRQLLSILALVLRLRPDVIITTGASPGYLAVRCGKLVGARTIWIDSIANADEMSMSGRLVQRYADHWLTQWEHLSGPEGPDHKGAVL